MVDTNKGVQVNAFFNSNRRYFTSLKSAHKISSGVDFLFSKILTLTKQQAILYRMTINGL
jgi:hypothetical protein